MSSHRISLTVDTIFVAIVVKNCSKLAKQSVLLAINKTCLTMHDMTTIFNDWSKISKYAVQNTKKGVSGMVS